MGEMAEAILNGDFCAECGVYIEGESEGVPRYCEDCEEQEDQINQKGSTE
jgi:hypothetical protein